MEFAAIVGSRRGDQDSVIGAARRCRRLFGLCSVAVLAAATAVSAQPPTETSGVTPVPSAVDKPVAADDDAAVLNPAEPDFVVVNLPTTMRLPRFKSNFRLTHRFAGNLRRGSFNEQASTLFGIDQGATIGFEYRIAVARDVQASFYRSSFDRTIQLHGKYDAVRQRRSMPVSVSAVASIEGTDNFQEKYAPSVGVIVSRAVGTRFAAYLTPIWVDNSAATLNVDRSTTFVGVGARVRVGGSTYVAAEIVPRVDGYAPDEASYGVSLEKRVGSHMFSLTFTNSFGTTFAQVARGGTANTLFLGFNLGRKFY